MIKSLVLNLDRSPDRLESMAAQFAALGIPFERVQGFDGRAASEEEFQTFCRERVGKYDPWIRGQMGCFLSHFRAWEITANAADPYTAIFEDDMHLSPSLKEFLETDSWIPGSCDIIRLETSTNRVWLEPEPLAVHGARALKKVKSTTWCAGGYILSRAAAKRLIALSASLHDSVDHMLFCHETRGVAQSLHISQIVPALCIQDKYFHENAQSIRFESGMDYTAPEIPWRERVKWPWVVLKKIIFRYQKILYAA